MPRTVASDDVKANPKLSSNNDKVIKDSVPTTNAARTQADSNATAVAACPEVIQQSSTTDSATLDVTLDTESSDEEAVVVASTIEPACAESTFKDELPNLSGNVDEEEVLEEDTDEATYEEKEKSTSDCNDTVEQPKVLLNNEAIEDTFNEAPKSDTESDNEEEESAKVQVKIEKEDVVVNEEGTAVNEKAKVSAEDEKTAVNEEKIVKQEHKVESGTKKKDARKSWAEQRIADMYASSSSSKAVLESKPKITVSREKAAAQRRKVEEMLRRSNDPKAFVQQKKENPELTPGKEELLARKKWVIETLHKQNDPKLFIDQRRNPGTTFDNSCVQKKDLESTDGGDQKAEEVLESVVNDSTVDGEDEKAQSLGMEEAGVKEKN